MRIRILSDLHREFGPTDIPRLAADLIVLAGDISTKLNGLGWMKDFCGDIPTAFVCGNHEFYGDKLPRVRERIQEATAETNIHALENAFFAVGDWFVYGCTLWTDMALLGDWQQGAAEAATWMNDYKRVRNSAKGYKRLTPAETRKLHLMSVESMRRFFESHDPRKTVIVTHHAPSIRSLPPKRRTEIESCAYASNLDTFIEEHQPSLWIHGHIHHNNDYTIGSTRIVANPQGYPMEVNRKFIPDLVLDV